MILRKSLFGLLLALVALSGTSVAQEAPGRPRNVIMFISDGCGPASFTLARDYMRDQLWSEELALDSILVGSLRTYSFNSRVTDSGASATAYACGIKTYNGAIGVDSLRRPVASLLEAAEERGMATGLVATSRITHATPAAYSSHVYNRGLETEIAAQQITKGIEVLFGGGQNQFLPDTLGGRRKDGRNLLQEAEQEYGYTVITDRGAFEALRQVPVLGLFAPDMMAYEIDRDPAEQPSLSDMTAKAIELLRDAPEGFFLMVEGSRIDHAAHANDAAAHLHDVLAFNAAVAGALDFAAGDGQTLVVSTSDHETGGITLGRSVGGRAVYSWEPEVLARVRHSHEYMGQRLLLGDRPDAVIREGTGIDDMTEEESIALDGAFDGRNTLPLFDLVTEMVGSRAVVGWTSTGHTAVDVNLYAYGPGADRFRGNHDNTYIGKALADLLGFDLDALTARLQAVR